MDLFARSTASGAADTPDGVALTPYDPGFESQMQAARDVMKRRRDVLRELAK